MAESWLDWKIVDWENKPQSWLDWKIVDWDIKPQSWLDWKIVDWDIKPQSWLDWKIVDWENKPQSWLDWKIVDWDIKSQSWLDWKIVDWDIKPQSWLDWKIVDWDIKPQYKQNHFAFDNTFKVTAANMLYKTILEDVAISEVAHSLTIWSIKHLSGIMRKPSNCICENKDGDQLRSNCTVIAKLISAFALATRIIQFLYFLNPKFPAYSHLLCLYSWVCVGPDRKPHCWFSRDLAHFYDLSYSTTESRRALVCKWPKGLVLEPRREKTNNVVSKQVRHKLSCTSTEDG